MKARGLTLIELLIVVVIIGVLAAMLYPQFQSFYLRARLKEVPNTVEMIYAAERYYRYKNNRYYDWDWATAGNNYTTASGESVEDVLNITLPKGPRAMCLYIVSSADDEIKFASNEAAPEQQGWYDLTGRSYSIIDTAKWAPYLKYLE